LSASPPDSVPAIDDAEQREPEELVGAELQRQLGQHRRERARHSTPNSVPSTEPDVAMPMARPAWPWRASA
jgi:hypothetical protein